MYAPKFNWAEYLKLAEQLAGRYDEAAQRAAISRAYYAVYCKARNRLEDWQELDRNETRNKSHQVVWEHFEGDPRQGWSVIGQEGHDLKEDRRKADYDDKVGDLSRLTQKAMKRAKWLERSLRQLSR